MSIRVHLWLKPALWALPLAWLWFRLIGQLRIGWSVNPQYAYGWAVPFLCLYLIWRRAGKQDHRTTGQRGHATNPVVSSRVVLWSLAACAFLYAPVCLIQEANPGWSLATWPLALITIALTLGLIRLTLTSMRVVHSDQSRPARDTPSPAPVASVADCLSRLSLSDFVFPICFFLVAVPWPFALEQPVIQGLTRLNTALSVEVLGVFGIPAVPQGNVIEIATGSVGIEEACSGIRSLQATLMISLFLGEFRRLSVSRRLLCVLLGAALAMGCNWARTVLLCWVAASRGIAAIAGWHDPAGVTILVACFLGVWGLSWALQKAQGGNLSVAASGDSTLDVRCSMFDVPPSEVVQTSSAGKASVPASPVRIDFSFSAFQRFSIVLTAWLLLVEVGVAAWYRHLEVNLPTQATWHIAWPATNSVCRDLPIAPQAAQMLRYDEARRVQWVEGEGTQWQLSWFYWKPGQTAAYLARTHNPLICMPAAGYQTSTVSAPEYAEVNGLKFPFRIYGFEESGKRVYILYSRWEDRAKEQSFASEGVTRFNRLRSVWTGRGNQGQRVISLALWTGADPQGARQQLLQQLQDLLVVNPLR